MYAIRSYYGILLWFEQLHGPAPDAAFLVSNLLGLGLFCVALVGVMIGWHLSRGEKREAWVWLAVGLATWIVIRITSYNVCYTKLLRLPQTRSRASCSAVAKEAGLPSFISTLTVYS